MVQRQRHHKTQSALPSPPRKRNHRHPVHRHHRLSRGVPIRPLQAIPHDSNGGVAPETQRHREGAGCVSVVVEGARKMQIGIAAALRVFFEGKQFLVSLHRFAA